MSGSDSTADWPIGLSQRLQLTSPSCGECVLSARCGLSGTTLQCRPTSPRLDRYWNHLRSGERDALVPSGSGWVEAVERTDQLSWDFNARFAAPSRVPPLMAQVRPESRLALGPQPGRAVCLSLDRSGQRGRTLRSRDDVLERNSLPADTDVYFAVRGRDPKLRRFVQSFRWYTEQIKTAGYDYVLGPALSAYDGDPPAHNYLQAVLSSRLAAELARSGIPVIPAMVWYQQMEASDVTDKILANGILDVWVDLATPNQGDCGLGAIQELAWIAERIPSTKIIVYGVASESRMNEFAKIPNVAGFISGKPAQNPTEGTEPRGARVTARTEQYFDYATYALFSRHRPTVVVSST